MAERSSLIRTAGLWFSVVAVCFYFGRAIFVFAFLPMPFEDRVIPFVLIVVGIVLSTRMILSAAQVRDGKSTKFKRSGIKVETGG